MAGTNVSESNPGQLELQLQLQVSLLCCKALESEDTVDFLQQNIQYHNGADFYLQETQPVRFLVLVSDNRVEHSKDIKSALQAKLEPTVYVSFANQSPGMACFPAKSLANFYCPQSRCNFTLAEGAQVQRLVCQLLDAVPVQALLNLLGQGYRIVFSGHQFGGLLANAMAAKLLLQLRQEIQMAQELGVNLSALTMTEDKVVSYAFAAPLFGCHQLHDSLQRNKLHDNINTIWKRHDASSHFFTLCSELYMATAPTTSALAEAVEDATAAPSSLLQPCQDFSTAQLLQQTRTAQFKVIQAWCASVSQELGKLTRNKHLALSAAPLDLTEANKLQKDLEGLLCGGDWDLATAAMKDSTADGAKGAPKERRSPGSSKLERSSTGSLAGSMKTSVVAAASRLLDQHTMIKALKTVTQPGRVTPTATTSPKPAGALSKSRTSHSGDMSGHIPSGSRVSRQSSSALQGPATSSLADGQHSTATAAGRSGSSQTFTSCTWKGALHALLECVDSTCTAPQYASIGQFWLLDSEVQQKQPEADAMQGTASIAASMPALARTNSHATSRSGSSTHATDSNATYTEETKVSFKMLPPSKAAAVGQEWLAEENPHIFSRWESSLDEFKKDLMEAFAWAVFKPTATVDGGPVSRKLLIRPMHMHDIC